MGVSTPCPSLLLLKMPGTLRDRGGENPDPYREAAKPRKPFRLCDDVTVVTMFLEADLPFPTDMVRNPRYIKDYHWF